MLSTCAVYEPHLVRSTSGCEKGTIAAAAAAANYISMKVNKKASAVIYLGLSLISAPLLLTAAVIATRYTYAIGLIAGPAN